MRVIYHTPERSPAQESSPPNDGRLDWRQKHFTRGAGHGPFTQPAAATRARTFDSVLRQARDMQRVNVPWDPSRGAIWRPGPTVVAEVVLCESA